MVVGFGGAGVAAAVEAREAGADLLAIDRFGGGETKRGGSLRALAHKCRINAQALDKTVADFNMRCATGAADPFGKATDKLVPLGKGPYYAVTVSLSNKFGPTFTFTLVGLSPNEETGHVTREDGTDIPGPYVAGRHAATRINQREPVSA